MQVYGHQEEATIPLRLTATWHSAIDFATDRPKLGLSLTEHDLQKSITERTNRRNCELINNQGTITE